jgi:hypothetical protein
MKANDMKSIQSAAHDQAVNAANSAVSAKARKAGGTPFPKGKSGNPSGRPKVVGPVRDLAREYTADAIKTLVSVMRGKTTPAAAKVTAAAALLDRGWGKPSQPVGGTDDLPPIKTVHELSRVELMAIASQKPAANALWLDKRRCK